MDLQDDVLQLFEFLWRLVLRQNGGRNGATQFVGNSHCFDDGLGISEEPPS